MERGPDRVPGYCCCVMVEKEINVFGIFQVQRGLLLSQEESCIWDGVACFARRVRSYLSPSTLALGSLRPWSLVVYNVLSGGGVYTRHRDFLGSETGMGYAKSFTAFKWMLTFHVRLCALLNWKQGVAGMEVGEGGEG